MSLNGLDSPEVQEAYQAAIAEAAGWFLLQYVSRDGVELLARGRNGVSEARNAITAYTEASPLYGLIIYRRRRILIKYIPEDTSRLLQARTSVHFQDILERYSPYETLLEITTGEALNDTALAKTFQLHTASPSPSAGRLDEITEDGEDAGAEIGSIASGNVSSSSLSGAQRYKAARRTDNLSRRTERASRSTSSLQARGDSPPPTSPSKPALAQILVRENSGQTSITGLETPADNSSSNETSESGSHAASAKTNVLLATADETLENDFEPSIAPEERTVDAPGAENASAVIASEPLPHDETASPPPEHSAVSEASTSVRGGSIDNDPYDLSKYDKYFKPKVKLGPRPVTAAERAMRQNTARVSAVPASLKQARKQEPSRPKSRGGDSATPPTNAVQSEPSLRMPPPIPVEYSPRPYSRGSVKSAPSHRSTGMTPDRLRLMKAVELRKRQLRKSQEPSSFIPPVEGEERPEMPGLEQSQTELPSQPGLGHNTNEVNQQPDQEGDHVNTDDESQSQSIKADSGIEIRYETPIHDDRNERASSLHENITLAPSSITTMQPTVLEEQPATAASTAASETTKTNTISDPLKNEAMSTSGVNPSVNTTPTHDDATEFAHANAQIQQTEGSAAAINEGDTGAGATSSDGSDTLRNADATIETDSTALPRPVSSDVSKRRRGLVGPLHLEIPSGNPDDFTSDDELLEELHTATVQEARPIVVARSPQSSASPTNQFVVEDGGMVRSVSIARQLERTSTQRSQGEAEKLLSEQRSALLGTSPSEKADAARNAPRKVSSGISRRIQALNEMSTREANGSGYSLSARPLTPDTPPKTFLHQDHKARPVRMAPSPTARPMSFRRLSKNSGASLTPASTPPNEGAPVWNVHHDSVTSRNSVSVTARIVRSRTDPNEERLMHSELMINHNRDQPPKTNLRSPPPIDVETAQQSTVSSPALSPASRGSSDTRTLHSVSRFGRRENMSTTSATPDMDEFSNPPIKGTMSTDSINDDNGAPKTSTRASRFFKRVSNINAPKQRRSAQSVTDTASLGSLERGKDSKAVDRVSMATHRSDTPPAVVVGDLNVQFPDSLLWKRRIVTINEDGHLQFAIAHAMEIHKGVALRHFPLQDFAAPYAPDLDRQELANSVVLELQEGSTLQLACEDSMTQRQVLHLLKSYWKSWATV